MDDRVVKPRGGEITIKMFMLMFWRKKRRYCCG